MSADDPHDLAPVTDGAGLEDANAAVVMVHGRGATAPSILAMHQELDADRSDVAYLAPRAADNEWYPYSFTAPVEKNEPGRTSGLRAIARLIERAADHDVSPEHVLVMGFSQGACLATEYAARNPRRYGGVVALSGGLIGEELDEYDAREPDETMDGTPVFLGCSDVDPHIPLERVHETRDVFESLGADVTEEIYQGMGHGVNRDELARVSAMVDSL